jgi:transposase
VARVRIEDGVPVTGEDRARLRRKAAQLYRAGLSIRAVMDELDLSYGRVHLLLVEAGVEFRPRGGDQGGAEARWGSKTE